MKRREPILRRAVRWARHLAIVTCAIVTCMGLPLACSSEAKREGWNLILISIDTLRADRLGCYGYSRETSPTLDALAARGVRFEHVYAESSWTIPSHMTLLTGLHPSAHGILHTRAQLAEEVPLLTEVLAEAGFRTFAHTSGGFMKEEVGFQRGFELYGSTREPFSDTVERTIQTIRGLGSEERYFLFLHSYDVHCPFEPAPNWQSEFVTVDPEHRFDALGMCGEEFNTRDLSPEQVAYVSELYDAEIRQFDTDLARLMTFLEEEDELDRTVIAIVSDHGESFDEHGRIGHGADLYPESVRIPWILLAPDTGPTVVENPVGLCDVMPTVLELLNVAAPAVSGVSQVPQIRGTAAPDPERPLFSEVDTMTAQLRSVRLGDELLILDLANPNLALFDLEADPGAQVDISDEEPERSAELQQLLRQHYRMLRKTFVRPRPYEPNPDLSEEIKNLGYAGD